MYYSHADMWRSHLTWREKKGEEGREGWKIEEERGTGR
jgi:hypothetical protein